MPRFTMIDGGLPWFGSVFGGGGDILLNMVNHL